MVDRVNMPKQPIGQIKKTQETRTNGSSVRPGLSPSVSFREVLDQTLSKQELKFSAHAQARMMTRNITLSEQDMERVRIGVERAAEKGARESLVLMDKLALVVSVKNRTVITAVDEQSLKENVFTNIDSAVIV